MSRRIQQATERRTAEQYWSGCPRWIPVLLRRIGRFADLPAKGLADIGAAQGLDIVALTHAGWSAVGVEPSIEAIGQSEAVAAATDTKIEIQEAVTESLPLPYLPLISCWRSLSSST